MLVWLEEASAGDAAVREESSLSAEAKTEPLTAWSLCRVNARPH